jgi:hypothetical protein
MDFIEEKIMEAMENEPPRFAANGESAGAIPVPRDRLRENEFVQANFILVLGNAIEQRWASEWWTTSPKWSRASSNGPRAISSGGWPSFVRW